MSELRKDGFTFKHFFIAHDKSPMKVTTDSCLLGSWAPINITTEKVLDIGCGCGIIALMLAQRLKSIRCTIDAIDIDQAAINQSQENIINSPYKSVNAELVDIKQYRINDEPYYDLIVTNPPYFQSSVNCRNQQRQQARYTESLNHMQLIKNVKRLLKPIGYFCLVLPFHLNERFTELCKQEQLYLMQQLSVRYTQDKSFSLSLLCFSFNPELLTINQELSLRDSHGSYTPEVRQLLNEFYLFKK